MITVDFLSAYRAGAWTHAYREFWLPLVAESIVAQSDGRLSLDDLRGVEEDDLLRFWFDEGVRAREAAERLIVLVESDVSGRASS